MRNSKNVPLFLFSMRSKKRSLTCFSQAISSDSSCIRPDDIAQLIHFISENKPQKILARGSGHSYNESCLNKNRLVIDTSRFNHLIDFNSETGILICQGACLFRDLFLVHPDFIPPVIPGTIYATVAGGIAHDVHGKNNPHAGSLGQHITWFELLINDQIYQCSRRENQDLFNATIAGLGLTGIITRVALKLKKTTPFVHVKNLKISSLQELVESMSDIGLQHDYQVAWIDCYDSKKMILSVANHCEPITYKEKKVHSIPYLPFSFIHRWNIKLFNHFYFNSSQIEERLPIEQFNNPLDKVAHWNRLYGPKGLIQFQAVFNQEQAYETIQHLMQIIKQYDATPTLCVLKLFTQNGEGLLSFCKPGFTLAIDFINNAKAQEAILAMNQYMTEINGHIYLAKDLLLNSQQYQSMYPNHEVFAGILKKYESPMYSDLAQRLGINL